MRARHLFTAIASIAFLAVAIYAADEIKLDGVKCVMNPKAAAKAEKSVDYRGGKVFFCCDNCPKAFAKKIEAGDKVVAAKANAQLVATGQAKQSNCPISGAPLNEEQTIKVAGAAISFCCPDCKAKVMNMEGDEQLLAAFGDEAFKKAGFVVAGEDKDDSQN